MELLRKLFKRKLVQVKECVDERKTSTCETLVEDKWIKVKSWGNSWSGQTLYINSAKESAKVYEFEITHWGYHDESDIEEHERIISIEQALSMVYSDENAISTILNNSNKDYSETLRKLTTGDETGADDN